MQDLEEELRRRSLIMVEIMDATQRVRDLEEELRRRRVPRKEERWRRDAILAEIPDVRRKAQELWQELFRRSAVTIPPLNGTGLAGRTLSTCS